MGNRAKYNFLDGYKDKILEEYNNGYGLSCYKLSKIYKVSYNTMMYRLKKWGVYNPRRRENFIENLNLMKSDILLDRSSGMSIRFLELKYGINAVTLLKVFRESNLGGKIPKRFPVGEELENLLEDINSGLFFLDELSHIYCVCERVILEIGRQNKCLINIDYDNDIDFLMYEDNLTLKKIMLDRNSLNY